MGLIVNRLRSLGHFYISPGDRNFRGMAAATQLPPVEPFAVQREGWRQGCGRVMGLPADEGFVRAGLSRQEFSLKRCFRLI
jgi:hypothetical protein